MTGLFFGARRQNRVTGEAILVRRDFGPKLAEAAGFWRAPFLADFVGCEFTNIDATLFGGFSQILRNRKICVERFKKRSTLLIFFFFFVFLFFFCFFLVILITFP